MLLYKLGYNILIFFYGLALYAASLFSSKAKKWLKGRNNWREHISQGLSSNTNSPNPQPVLWLHAASLGEYEQAKNLLLKYRREKQNWFIVLSFFSPSGYEIIHNRNEKQRAQAAHLIDFCCYLPLDLAKNARDFIEIVNPALIIWVKYEFWYYYLRTAAEKQIPIYLIAVIFSPQHLIFSYWGKLTWQIMGFFTQIFTQDQASQNNVFNFLAQQPKDSFYLKNNFYNKIVPAGDTRIDSIVQIHPQWQALPLIEWFINPFGKVQSAPVFIVGSSHKEDFPYLAGIFPRLWAEGWKIILVPHEIDPKSVQKTVSFLESLNSSPLLYSNLETTGIENLPKLLDNLLANNHSLIVDKIGLLKYAYHYANFAYIGGGFSGGVHNVLEAAVYGLPTAFGGVLHKFTELKQLLDLNAAFYLQPRDKNISQKWFSFIQNAQTLAEKNRLKAVLTEFFSQHQGATEKIYNQIR